MLYPTTTATRTVLDLSGLWKFMLETEGAPVDATLPLPTTDVMAVPASFNDQSAQQQVREHVGYVWYETTFSVADFLRGQRLILRFGSATHEAWVYLNGQEITHHKGGFTPFEVAINDNLVAGENRLTVKLSNMLDYTSLPVAHYSETHDADGKLVRHLDENFDFFNYAGLQRPVKIYTTPRSYVADVTVVPEVDLDQHQATVDTRVVTQGDVDRVRVTLLDATGQPVATGTGKHTQLTLPQVHLWQPLHAYLYTARVEALKNDQVVDSYDEPFGVRKIEVTNGQFLFNGEPFYFKGFGKHEDSAIHGRGLNQPANVLDINLMKKMGANSFRTSHYPYSDEMMRLCDREGIVVIDEVPAVGLFASFGFDLSGKQDNTWQVMQTAPAHQQAIREMIDRDKNHACVAMWSISNEAANFTEGAYEYFKPLFDLARQLDPQNRPCTYTSIMQTTAETDKCISLVDVIALNRYYGWYVDTGDLAKAETATRDELALYQQLYPDKPIIYTEYGTDTIAGVHSNYGEPFSEEFQEDYYRMTSKVFDEFDNFVGEQLWNFADFQTKFGIQRVQGNKKGIFTRDREPKMVVRYLSRRWNAIPNLGYKQK
ncbi:beta-glucuronidase [Levilactobacillus acidifarinae]|uniref:Beta-glucuronidase n=1 Tax=Levilactobacillus acidifarinae DSM 19394 = JCM 15949 TaxID=1423715 RepID=A0A0R1LUE0_9LACO|nr:beta-glucuronidase [Levilactobacillus acidifarinae]KRK96457.1 beta-glucuronidase [Levilactobacillus acidifarinae DSM 19394]GEO68957.1 beta-glucuronidase [Levilactobacillus acidifarinae]